MRQTQKDEINQVLGQFSVNERDELKYDRNHPQEMFDDLEYEKDCGEECLGAFDFQF
jgi:hypothetical protein